MIEVFTRTTSRLFWTLNIGGWAGYAALNYLSGLEMNNQPLDYFIPSLWYAAGGIVITSGLRLVFRALWNLKPLVIFLLGGLSSVGASVMFTAFRSFVYVQYYERYAWSELSLLDTLNFWDLYLSLYVIGTWSALYFSIKYYRTVQFQKERLLKASNAAQKAQLSLLRYQLNPHFLFNTLNAVSTLVLEGAKDEANQLLTKLSQFLRVSLESDPVSKAALEREIDTVQLYLDIEQVRFGDQLTVHWNIEAAAKRALVPSMVLHPLVDHAIQNAVAVSEEGGSLHIAGFIEDGKLCLRVADSGPGETGSEGTPLSRSDEVDLGNTRERLQVLYGDGQDIRLDQLESGGLGVTISIPLELARPENARSPDRR